MNTEFFKVSRTLITRAAEVKTGMKHFFLFHPKKAEKVDIKIRFKKIRVK